MTKQKTPEKTVPYNEEAEIAVLGAVPLDHPRVITQVRRVLNPEHFYLLKHQWIYEAYIALADRNDPIDLITITAELDAQQRLEAVGGALYLSQLIGSVPSAIHADSYARLVHEAWKRRQLLNMTGDLAKLAFDEKTDLASAADYVRARMDELLTHTGPQTYQDFATLAGTLAPIQWLWPGWVPLGMITLLGASPGAGKSMVALDLGRRVMHGLPWPNGVPNPRRDGANVIYVDAEMVPQLLKERAENWQMDTRRLYLMLPNPNDMVDFSRLEYREKLRNMVATLKPSMVVIDSLSSVSSKGENNVEDIRQIMSFLNELASNFQIGLILIHHLRKRGTQLNLPGMDSMSIDDFRGSSHIIAMSRSVLGLSVIQTTQEINRNGPRKLEVVKTNLAAYPDPLGCELVPLQPSGVMLKWENEAPKPYREPTKTEQAETWLRDLLTGGEPLSPKEIIEAAMDEGFSQATIYRARKAIPEIVDTEGRQAPNNKWVIGGAA